VREYDRTADLPVAIARQIGAVRKFRPCLRGSTKSKLIADPSEDIVVQLQHSYRTPAGSIVRDLSKPMALVCLDIVREFLMQPRLRLTASQVARLWNLSPERCDAVLHSLVADGYLETEPDGRYVLSINKMYRTV
jgi:hypothetical protein